MVRLENWQLVNLVCTWRNFRKFLNFFLLLVEDGFRCLEIRRNPLAGWLAGWLAGVSFFFCFFLGCVCMVRVEKIWQIVDLVCGDVYRQLLFFLFWCKRWISFVLRILALVRVTQAYLLEKPMFSNLLELVEALVWNLDFAFESRERRVTCRGGRGGGGGSMRRRTFPLFLFCNSTGFENMCFLHIGIDQSIHPSRLLPMWSCAPFVSSFRFATMSCAIFRHHESSDDGCFANCSSGHRSVRHNYSVVCS